MIDECLLGGCSEACALGLLSSGIEHYTRIRANCPMLDGTVPAYNICCVEHCFHCYNFHEALLGLSRL